MLALNIVEEVFRLHQKEAGASITSPGALVELAGALAAVLKSSAAVDWADFGACEDRPAKQINAAGATASLATGLDAGNKCHLGQVGNGRSSFL